MNLKAVFHSFQLRIESWLIRLTASDDSQREWWVSLKVGLTAWALSIVMFAPSLWTIFEPGRLEQSRAGSFLKMCHNPFAWDLDEPILAYRIVTPFICWILHLPDWLCLILPGVFTAASLGIIFQAVAKKTDRLFAVLLTVAVACSYTIIWPNTKPGFPDGVTHFATAVALTVTSPITVFCLTIFGTMNDERFVVAIPFILLWHTLEIPTIAAAVKKSWRYVAGFGIGLIAVSAFRHALTVGWIGRGIPHPQEYTNQMEFWSGFFGWAQRWAATYIINVLASWRWLWIAWIVGIGVAWKRGGQWWVVLLVLGTACGIIATMVVADVSRSIGFFFPTFICALTVAYKSEKKLIYNVLLWSVIACLCSPAFYLTERIQWSRPLPLSALRWITGWDVTDVFRAKQ